MNEWVQVEKTTSSFVVSRKFYKLAESLPLYINWEYKGKTSSLFNTSYLQNI